MEQRNKTGKGFSLIGCTIYMILTNLMYDNTWAAMLGQATPGQIEIVEKLHDETTVFPQKVSALE